MPTARRLADLPDGRYQAGFRPNHLSVDALAGDAIRFDAKVTVTEITGSESFVHLDHFGTRWVALAHGVRDLVPGAGCPVWLDPAHVYVFGETGELVAPAPYALAA